jgi:hypothetical protein
MKTPETSRLFIRWKNPKSGIESFVLTERLAPVQQTFYFTNPSMTDDGRFLWVSLQYPPAGGRHAAAVLGVVDFERDEMRVYHETQHPSARPVVDMLTGDIYWGNHLDFWKRGPHAGDKPVLVNRFPKELVGGRMDRLATHLIFSADRRTVNIDARFVRRDGSQVCHIGAMPLDGSPFELWQTIEGRFHDHAIFSPTDPNEMMFAYEYWQDHEPFDHDKPYHRLWFIRKGEKARPILNAPVSHSGHEWWDSDGKHVWYVHYGVGIKKVDLATGIETMKWPGALSHGYSDQTGRWLVADKMADPVISDCHVVFRDTVTDKEVELVNRPPLADHLTQCTHLHPHPQFCCRDRYICHTTTIHDRVDVVLVPVGPLIAETAA